MDNNDKQLGRLEAARKIPLTPTAQTKLTVDRAAFIAVLQDQRCPE